MNFSFAFNLPEVSSVLAVVWFLLVAVLWIGYLVLEGFDYGVAMLIPFLGKNEKERRVIINTIGPVWDGNEVWLLTAGGAMFLAFPAWYATLFSGLYLPLFLVLVGLIIRGVSFEYRSKNPDTKWRSVFDWLAAIGSFLVPLVFGVGFANFIIGLPVVPDPNNPALYVIATDAANVGQVPYFWELFSPFGLLGGIAVVAICLFHGSIYLTLKTKGEVKERAKGFAKLVGLVTIVGGAVFLICQNLFWAPMFLSGLNWILVLVAAVALIGAWLTIGQGKSFTLSAVAILAVALGIFIRMLPTLGFVDAGTRTSLLADGSLLGLNIFSAASQDSTLTIALIAALIMVPIVLAYTIWAYWVFRRPVGVENIPDDAEAVPA
ncbi:MAG: cytochrome d ubiquinol oxidase subunit II [Propionibacteriaceae bacterium]|jgi:cytochrome d ubiquinol oxidase subunit II|nr:cytochrome d ubiquinol oxidase subunit II [Propionibacteriaceae bacterium]